jgi:predicted Zn-dependent protease
MRARLGQMRTWRVVVLFAAVLALTGLSGSPARADDAEIEQEAKAIVDLFGGVYDDPKLAQYIAGVGNRLVQTTPMAKQPFTFTVLDSPAVNAFSLPGGHVFVTRGLLALVGNEAELAGVLGHEIGHITAHHAESRERRAAIARLGVGLLAIFGARLATPEIGHLVQRFAGVGGLYYVERFSREQEFEADVLGTRTLARAGYSAYAMSSFLATLEATMRLDNRAAGRASDDERFSMFADHPRTDDRVRRAIAEAGKQPSVPDLRRNAYLRKIDGMLYGDNPDKGVVRGGWFIHPALRIAFGVPPGFEIENTESRVVAESPDNAGFLFDRAPEDFDGTPEAYLADVSKSKTADPIRHLDINGLAAATVPGQAKTDDGTMVNLQLVVIRVDPHTLYRFVFVYPPKDPQRFVELYERVTASFRRISMADAARIKPRHLRIITVQSWDTLDGLAAHMALDSFPRERFQVLNGLGPDAAPKPGRTVKLVTE